MTGSPDEPVRRENPTGAPHPGPVYPYQPGEPPPYYAPPQPVTPKNGLGIAALVLAVVGLLSVATVFAPIILGVIAVVIGAVGRGRAKRGIANNGGIAIAGIVLGGLAIVVGLAFIAIWLIVIGAFEIVSSFGIRSASRRIEKAVAGTPPIAA